MFKMRSALLIFLYWCTFSVYAADENCFNHPAMKDVIKTVDNIVSELESKRSQIKQQPKLVYGIINRLMVPKADFDVMSRLVLTRNWNKLSSKQKKDFTKEFSRLMIRTYGVAFESYDGETVGYSCPMRKLQSSGNSQRYEISTTIHSPNRPDSVVKFRILEKEKACESCKKSVSFCKKLAGNCKELQQQYVDLKKTEEGEGDSARKSEIQSKIVRTRTEYDACKEDYDNCKTLVDECKADCEQCQKCEQQQAGNCSECDSKWLVYDLIIDNVSIINSYRQVFKDKFRKQKDPNKIIADMHKKNCKDKMFCV